MIKSTSLLQLKFKIDNSLITNNIIFNYEI